MSFWTYMMTSSPQWLLATVLLGFSSLFYPWMLSLTLFAAAMTALGILGFYIVALFGPGLPLPTPIARATGRDRPYDCKRK